MVGLTRDDLIDLGRWHAICFADEATEQRAQRRYQFYLDRQAADGRSRYGDERMGREGGSTD